MKITMQKGEHRTIGLRIGARQSDGSMGAPQSLASATEIVFVVKRRTSDADAAAVITKTMTAGAIVLRNQGTNPGELDVTILPADTAGKSAGPHVWDLWVIGSSTSQPAHERPQPFELVQPVRLGA
jgi:hypothetical protein